MDYTALTESIALVHTPKIDCSSRNYKDNLDL